MPRWVRKRISINRALQGYSPPRVARNRKKQIIFNNPRSSIKPGSAPSLKLSGVYLDSSRDISVSPRQTANGIIFIVIPIELTNNLLKEAIYE